MYFNFYGLLISLGTLLGYLLVTFRAKKYNLIQRHIDNLFIFITLASVIGARLYHVIDKWEYYSENLLRAFFIWQGGIGIFGALTGGLVALVFYCWRNKLDYRELGDIIAPSVLLGQAVGRVGNYFNLEGFGPPTDLPWKIPVPIHKRPEMWGSYEHFHPTFFYESALCLIAFFILLWVGRYTKKDRGLIFGLYLISYGLIRIVTESFRLDTAEVGGIRVAYIFSVVFVILGVKLLWRQPRFF